MKLQTFSSPAAALLVISSFFVPSLAQGQIDPQDADQSVRITGPSDPTIPPSVQVAMVRVDMRLVTIEATLKRIERSLNDLEADVDSLLPTKHVLNFIIIVFGLVIPVVIGVLLTDYLKQRRSKKAL